MAAVFTRAGARARRSGSGFHLRSVLAGHGPFSSDAATTVAPPAALEDRTIVATGEEDGDDLRSRIFRLGLAKRSATAALEKWSSEGRATPAADLRRIARDLSRVRRYKHALEPTARPNSPMAVRYLRQSGSDSTDEEGATEASKHRCSSGASSGVSDASAYAAHVEELCRSGNLADAVCVLRRMQDEQIHVGLHTFNFLLQHTAEANTFTLSAKVFRYLLLSKLAPDSTSYLNVAKALQKLDDWELIQKFVRQLLEITHRGDPTVMNRIIFVTAKYGGIDKSLVIFEELKKDQTSLDVVTFNTILDVLGKAGRVDQMLHEVKLMEELGHFPDIVTYNTLINCLRRLGRLGLCKQFAGEMLERGITPDLRTYTALIDSYGRSGHITDALEMFQKMKNSHQPSVYVYRAMISNLKKAGQLEVAQKLTEDMNSSASELLGPEDFKSKNKGIEEAAAGLDTER